MNATTCFGCQKGLSRDFIVCLDCTNVWHEGCYSAQTGDGCSCERYMLLKSGVPDRCIGDGCKSDDGPLCMNCRLMCERQILAYVLGRKNGAQIDNVVHKGCSMPPLSGCKEASNLSMLRLSVGHDIVKTSSLLYHKPNGLIFHVFDVILEEICAVGTDVDIQTHVFKTCEVDDNVRRLFRQYIKTYTKSDSALVHYVSDGRVCVRTKHMMKNKETMVERIKLSGTRGILVHEIFGEYPTAYKDFYDLVQTGSVMVIESSVFYRHKIHDIHPGAIDEWLEALKR